MTTGIRILQSDPYLLQLALEKPGEAAKMLAKQGIVLGEADLHEIKSAMHQAQGPVHQPDQLGDIFSAIQPTDGYMPPMPGAPGGGGYVPSGSLGDVLAMAQGTPLNMNQILGG